MAGQPDVSGQRPYIFCAIKCTQQPKVLKSITCCWQQKLTRSCKSLSQPWQRVEKWLANLFVPPRCQKCLWDISWATVSSISPRPLAENSPNVFPPKRSAFTVEFGRLSKLTCPLQQDPRCISFEQFPRADIAGQHGVRGVARLGADFEGGDARCGGAGGKARAQAVA